MIELTTSALVLFSLFYGGGTANVKPVDSQVATVKIISVDRNIDNEVALVAPNTRNRSVEGDVREYFADTPILIEVAKCESDFRHLEKDGEIIRGLVNKSDIGVMQINTYYHNDKAKELGLDLTTLKGNMAYAKYLYDKEGTAPWQSSAPCWDKSVAVNKK
jgi:hypothetical protein